MTKQIIVNFVKQEEMREDFWLGDYYMKDGKLIFDIVDSGSDFTNKRYLVHELIEQMLTEYSGITEKEIHKFDKQFDKECKLGIHSEDAEPGDSPDCFYRRQHQFAMLVEGLLLNFIDKDTNCYG